MLFYHELHADSLNTVLSMCQRGLHDIQDHLPITNALRS